ncbi:MAG: hypothetical protein ACREVI_02145 [Steroidobacteraceae bacterium]
MTRSVAVLWRLRRKTIIVQSPSVVLAATALALAPLFRLRVALDAHNEAVRPFTHDSRAMRWLINALLRRACLVIVTNDELAGFVSAAGGRPFVLPDAIPDPPVQPPPSSPAAVPVVLCVCTYAPDEPVAVFIEAARRLQRSVEFRITGRPHARALELLATRPANLKVLGFLSEADYWSELAHADLVVDLTLKPNCLVCGAYEAIAVDKSPLLSDDISNRRLFGDAATYIENTPDSLARAIVENLERGPPGSMRGFRDRYMNEWRGRLAALSATLDA